MSRSVRSRVFRVSAATALLAGGVALFALRSTSASATGTTTLYVSPAGSDSNSGTSYSAAFQHIAAAQAAVRAMIPTLSTNVVVYLEGGTYPICDPSVSLCPAGSELPLTFTTADSAPSGYTIQYTAYPGQSPVLDGGYTVPASSWSQNSSAIDLWQAPIPAGLETRDVYVNGQRAQHAVSMGGFQPDISNPLPLSVQQTSTGYVVDDTRPRNWGLQYGQRIEFVWTGVGANGTAGWSESRCQVASVAAGSGDLTTITMQEPCYHNVTTARDSLTSSAFEARLPTSIEGVPFGQDFRTQMRPGQWEVDPGDHLLLYVPLNGQVLNGTGAVPVVIGQTQTLISVTGTSTARVQNLQFNGIKIENTTWLGPDSGVGFPETQANQFYVDTTTTPPVTGFPAGAVDLQHTTDIVLDSDTFTDLGGTSVWVHNGSTSDQVSHSEIYYTAANGIQIGDTNPYPAEQDLNDDISYDTVHDNAQVYRGGVGIYGGYVDGLQVVSNTVYNEPYTGISVGWGWGKASVQGGNRISQNLVYNFMQMGPNGMPDGGGIYSSGANVATNQSAITYNYIRDGAPGIGGIYLDANSAYWSCVGNVVGNSQERWWFTFGGNHESIGGSYTDALPDRGDLGTDPTNSQSGNSTGLTSWPSGAQTIINGAGA